MTREEAIRCLDVYSSTNGSGLCTDKQHYEAKQMAIKALEHEPCEDAISRQAVLDMMQIRMSDKELYMAIHELSPVNPQPKTGHWIFDQHNWHCSECGESPKTMGYVGSAEFMAEHFKYCNHCGAKMVEPQESEE